MSEFRKGQKVVRVFKIMGSKCASDSVVASVKGGVVKLRGEESLSYRDADGSEIDPAIPGCSSEIIPWDGD